jgi:hypothetical protein
MEIDRQDGQPRGFAFVWRRFEMPELPVPMLACVMATVPGNARIRRTIKSREEDPRIPAILDDAAWSTRLGRRRRDADGGQGFAEDYGRRGLASSARVKKPRFCKP